MGVGADTARQAGVGPVGGIRGQHLLARLPGTRAQKAVCAAWTLGTGGGGTTSGAKLGTCRGRLSGGCDVDSAWPWSCLASTCALCPFTLLHGQDCRDLGGVLLWLSLPPQKPPRDSLQVVDIKSFILMPQLPRHSTGEGHGSSTSSHGHGGRTHFTRSCGGLGHCTYNCKLVCVTVQHSPPQIKKERKKGGEGLKGRSGGGGRQPAGARLGGRSQGTAPAEG